MGLDRHSIVPYPRKKGFGVADLISPAKSHTLKKYDLEARMKNGSVSKIKRGLLIAFEGLDRSGKSSQIAHAASYLKKRLNTKNVSEMRFPNRESVTGKTIDLVLQDKLKMPKKALHLLFSANRWEEEENILQAVNKDSGVILMDRYCYSGVAYSLSGGLDKDWCISADRGLPRPDLVIFLDVKPEETAKRSGFGEEIYEKLEFQKKVYSNFMSLKEENWVLVNANRDVGAISAEIEQILDDLIEAKSQEDGSPLKQLWV